MLHFLAGRRNEPARADNAPRHPSLLLSKRQAERVTTRLRADDRREVRLRQEERRRNRRHRDDERSIHFMRATIIHANVHVVDFTRLEVTPRKREALRDAPTY